MKNKLVNIKNSKIVGFYLLFIGVVALIKILFLKEFKIVYIVLVLLLIPSIDLIIRGVLKKKNRGLIIPGISFGLTSIFLLIYIPFLDKTFFNILRIWPIFGIFPSLGLIVYYVSSTKKDPKIIVPGIFLGLLSIIFLFYTCGIISFKFRFIILLIIPLLIIFVGLYFIFSNEITFYKKKMENKSDGKNLTKKVSDKD
ncbi:MAG TPA: hypothetical protein PK771_03945 [Spirochaetota bacterium]|nr:hypothetical protein [Spirochaetota bacterium]